MIEVEIIKYLKDQNIAHKHVYAEVPEKPEKEYCVILKTASSIVDGVQQALIAIQSYSSESLLQAIQLSESVKSCILNMSENSHAVYGTSLNTETNTTNTATKEYRYTAVFDFYY